MDGGDFRSAGAAVAALLQEVRACTLCAAVLPLGPRPVLQFGATARLLIVGQAPGRRVHETGVPFNDPSGRRLRQWLGVSEAVFYDPARVALLPMGFCYPGTGRSGDLPPRPECAAAWRPRLLEALPAVELTIVIGQYAMAWHLPQETGSLTEIVQRWTQSGGAEGGVGAGGVAGVSAVAGVAGVAGAGGSPEMGRRVIPLPHPSPRNNRWLLRNPWFESMGVPRLQRRIREVLGDG